MCTSNVLPHLHARQGAGILSRGRWLLERIVQLDVLGHLVVQGSLLDVFQRWPENCPAWCLWH